MKRSAAKMEKTLFRKESYDRISSPEQMRDYMRVTSPRLWMLLAAMIALLAGFLVYASTTMMETTLELSATVDQSGVIQAVVTPEQARNLEIGMKVRIGGKNARVAEIVQMMGGATGKQTTVLIEPEEDLVLPEGLYQATVVTESISPIDFLMN
jgi:hypothetical protein